MVPAETNQEPAAGIAAKNEKERPYEQENERERKGGKLARSRYEGLEKIALCCEITS